MIRLKFAGARGVSTTAKCVLAYLIATPAALSQSPSISPHSSTADDEATGRLDEIVVTSRKREELLQQVPISVAALTGSELQKQSLQDLKDVGQFVPNFTVGQAGNSGNSSTIIYIRGVGQTDALSTYDPAVGIYVDGVYVGRLQGNDIDTLDIARMEVLRGPQGTLFGKNTDGGAVSIVTQQPDAAAGALHGHLQLTTGQFRRFDVNGSINIPIISDTAALELSAARFTQDGYGHRVDGQQMGNRDRDVGRMALLLKPTEGLSIVVRADVTTYNEANASFYFDTINAGAPVTSGMNAYLGAIGAPLYDSRWVPSNSYFNYGTGPNYSTGSLFGTSLTVDWAHEWGGIKSITAWRKNSIKGGIDPDGSPIDMLDSYQRVDQYQYSEEVQASGSSMSGRLKWVGGLYLFGEQVTDHQAFDLPAINTAFTALTGAPFDANFDEYLRVSNRSYAAYTQGTYSFTEALSLTLGIRDSFDHKFVGRNQLSFPGPSGDYFAFDGSPIQPYAGKTASWNAISPRISIDYRWTPSIMTYVSAAQGFKSGGFNGRASSPLEFNQFQPEKVWTYEVGLRSDWWQQQLRLNLTGFYSSYKDLQVLDSSAIIVDGKPVALTLVDNVPRARIAGGEAEIQLIPLKGLRIDTSLGLTEGKYTELLPGSSLSTSLQFPFTPTVSATIGGQYATPIGSGLEFTGRLDYSHKSTINYDLLNAPTLRQKSYGLLNAKMTFDVLQSGLSVSVFGTNLTGTRYFTGGNDDSNAAFGWAFVTEAPPRQWGVSGQYRF